LTGKHEQRSGESSRLAAITGTFGPTEPNFLLHAFGHVGAL
jgi:hypothetical protein